MNSTTKKYTTFNIIRHRGMPNKAQLPDGTWVYRQGFIYIPETDRSVPCAPYSDHFVFQIPDTIAKRFPGPAYRCTCGGAAGWVGPSGYVLDASAQGLMFVCLVHAQTGQHATGGAKWV